MTLPFCLSKEHRLLNSNSAIICIAFASPIPLIACNSFNEQPDNFRISCFAKSLLHISTTFSRLFPVFSTTASNSASESTEAPYCLRRSRGRLFGAIDFRFMQICKNCYYNNLCPDFPEVFRTNKRQKLPGEIEQNINRSNAFPSQKGVTEKGDGPERPC